MQFLFSLSQMGPGTFRLLLATIVVITHYSALNLGGTAVDLFFVLSGYWVTRMWNLKYSLLDRPYAVFMRSRVWRLAPIFWLCSGLAIFITSYLPTLIATSKPALHMTHWQLLSFS